MSIPGKNTDRYTGRFAPTPSGPLHFGSLVTAVASYCHARAQNGNWLLRIEDLDTPRVVEGSADNILHTLEHFGFEWDGEVVYQSQRFDRYEQILQEFKSRKLLYSCECSRRSLKSQQLEKGPLGLIYPGHCRHRNLTNKLCSQRLNVEHAGRQEFIDDHYGPYELDISTQVGDIVLKRIDGVYAYHLAVVVDDDYQGINHIVRGVDLLEVTSIHLYLYSLLNMEVPGYLHVPLIKNSDGKKLSKQTGATALDINQASSLLADALLFLGQTVHTELRSLKPVEVLNYAVSIWDPTRLPSA